MEIRGSRLGDMGGRVRGAITGRAERDLIVKSTFPLIIIKIILALLKIFMLDPAWPFLR